MNRRQIIVIDGALAWIIVTAVALSNLAGVLRRQSDFRDDTAGC